MKPNGQQQHLFGEVLVAASLHKPFVLKPRDLQLQLDKKMQTPPVERPWPEWVWWREFLWSRLLQDTCMNNLRIVGLCNDLRYPLHVQ